MPKPGRHKKRFGSSLVEILIAVFFIATILVITLSVSGGFTNIYRGRLQSIATKVASSEVERLRTSNYSSVVNGSVSDPDLSKLPQGTATRTITIIDGDPHIKEVIVTVTWVQSGVTKTFQLGTIIYEYGI